MNDLPENLSNPLYMFADDSKIFSAVRNYSDSEDFQHDLEKIEQWAKKWQLTFNESKCKVMHLGKNNPAFNYNMGETELEESNIEKDLGVFIDNKLSFDHHIQQAVNKANKILGLIRRTYKFLDKNSLRSLYTSLVRPILEYENTIWSPKMQKHVDAIEKVLTVLLAFNSQSSKCVKYYTVELA